MDVDRTMWRQGTALERPQLELIYKLRNRCQQDADWRFRIDVSWTSDPRQGSGVIRPLPRHKEQASAGPPNDETADCGPGTGVGGKPQLETRIKYKPGKRSVGPPTEIR